MSRGIVILAAGESRRMGEPKLLRALGGKPMVQHTIDLAAAAAPDELVVVLGGEADRHRRAIDAPSGAVIIENSAFADGQASSLGCGIGALGGSDWAVVLLADQPEISLGVLHAVVAATLDASEVVRTRYSDGPGHPVALHRTLWPEIHSLTGDEGARSLLQGRSTRWVDVHGPQPVDIDTPDAYMQAVARFARTD